MKRKSLLFITVVLAIVVTAALVGCTMSQDDLFKLADFSKSSGETGRNIEIYVKSADNSGAEVVVYHYLNGAVEEQYAGFDFSGLTYENGGSALKFNKDYFSNTNYDVDKSKVATFTGDVTKTKEFMGIDATNAKVTIKGNTKEKQLVSNSLTYSKVTTNKTYNVSVVVTMSY